MKLNKGHFTKNHRDVSPVVESVPIVLGRDTYSLDTPITGPDGFNPANTELRTGKKR